MSIPCFRRLLVLATLVAACCAGAAETATDSAPGAHLPFTSIEAESGVTNGSVVRLTKLPHGWQPTPAEEASGRAFVELSQTGDHLDLAQVPAADGIVVRFCIPDAPGGGGMTATLSLYVNGVFRQHLSLNSAHSWLYSNGTPNQNGQSNVPTAFPHVFWDEARALIAGGVKAGDTMRLQQDAGDTAAYYRLDVIDLEPVPPPLPQPADSLSVVDFGAGTPDVAADTAAIQACITAAKAQGKSVWLPPGTYQTNARFILDGVQVHGAGVWYTFLVDTVGGDAPKWVGRFGFTLTGTGAAVTDLSMDSPPSSNRAAHGPKPFTGGGTDWRVTNVWITHTCFGIWLYGDGGIVSGCRVRGTYADGININNGIDREVSHVQVVNNHVRGVGDDGIAVLCASSSPHGTTDITVRHNTVVANWSAAGCDIAGGTGHHVEDNLFADGMMEGLTLNLPIPFPMQPLTDTVVQRNLLLRCGSDYAGQRRGAIWIYANCNEIRGVRIADNRIVAPLFRGIHCTGIRSQAIVFANNTITDPGEDAIVIDKPAIGSGSFAGNRLEGLRPGFAPIVNQAGKGYQLTQSGNSWQDGDK